MTTDAIVKPRKKLAKPSSEILTKILEGLRADGQRLTKVRRLVLSIFSELTTPLSVPELLKLLKQEGLSVNKTTVYRELDFLIDNQLVTEIDLLDGLKRYELSVGQEHHHHLVCRSCRSIQCVGMDNDLDSLERKIKKQHGFRVESHVLEFFGLCKACAG